MSSGTNIPFGENDPDFLGRYRYKVAGFIKYLISARTKQEPDYLSNEIRERWTIDEEALKTIEGRSCVYLLLLAKQHQMEILAKYVGYRDSIPYPESEADERLENLRENIATFVDAQDLETAIQQARNGGQIDWAHLAKWKLLSAIRSGLDLLPKPQNSNASTKAEPSASTKSAGDRPVYVTLLQAASLVNRSKDTLRKMGPPTPEIKGGKGKPHEWLWAETMLPWLRKNFPDRPLPDKFPGER